MIRLGVSIEEVGNGYVISTHFKNYGALNIPMEFHNFAATHEVAEDHWVASSLEEAMAIATDVFLNRKPVPSVIRKAVEHGG